jgi:subtilisin family serine protease
MATPHVAGAVALILGRAADQTPAEVEAHLRSVATLDKLTWLSEGSPNLILFVKE